MPTRFRSSDLCVLLFVLPVLLSLPALGPQGDPQPVDQATTDARTILARAIEAQDPNDVASGLRDLTVDLQLTMRDPEKGTFTVDVEQTFEPPDHLWSRVREDALSGVVYEEGFDGTTAWHHGKDGLISFEGPDFKVDRKRIKEQIERTQLLVRFFFLANLEGELKDLKKIRDDERTIGSGVASKTVRAHVLEGRGVVDVANIGPARLLLWIDHDTHHLLGARLERDEAPDEPMQFCFWFHRPNPQGVIVPGKIELYLRDESRPLLQIFMRAEEAGNDQIVNGIRFNTEPAASLFSPPDPD